MARRLLIVASMSVAALIAGGCGSQGVSVSKSSPERKGAVLFVERCGACHTLSPAGTQGSATNVGDRENVDGPNFDTRVEKVPDVIYAIENGGFSGAIMPENIATGSEKVAIAQFLAKYAGTKVARAPAAKGVKPVGAGGTPAK
jgi:mono/diheme cytochrome c family protein